MKKLFFLTILLVCLFPELKAQYTVANAHSHNDYQQKNPFWEAYQNHFGSVEADIWAVNGQLLVAHTKEQLTKERSLDKLYIQPILTKFRENKGKAWNDLPGTFQLLIDLKTNYPVTLPLLVEELKKYPEVFDSEVNPNAVKVVITGDTPPPAEFVKYPGFIFFDGKLYQKYTASQRQRIAMFSDDIHRYTSWNGGGTIPEKDLQKLNFLVDSVHALPCKIRFWDAPDNENAWKTLMNLKVDYINTDHIPQLAKFLKEK
jgi:alkaline phosphatase